MSVSKIVRHLPNMKRVSCCCCCCCRWQWYRCNGKITERRQTSQRARCIFNVCLDKRKKNEIIRKSKRKSRMDNFKKLIINKQTNKTKQKKNKNEKRAGVNKNRIPHNGKLQRLKTYKTVGTVVQRALLLDAI